MPQTRAAVDGRPPGRHVTVLSIVLIAVVAVFAFFLYKVSQDRIISAEQRRVELLSNVISSGLRTIMVQGKPIGEFQKFIESVLAEDIEAVRVFSQRGIIIGSSNAAEIGKVISPAHLTRIRQGADTSLFVHRVQDSEIYSAYLLFYNEWPCQKCHGQQSGIRGGIDIEVSARSTEQALGSLRLLIVAGFLVASVLVVALIRSLHGRHVRRPLRSLRDELLTSVSAGERAVLPVTSDELSDIAGMVARIRRDIETLRDEVQRCHTELGLQREKMASLGEVAAAVAHEIKNPLAGISGALQVLSEDIPFESPRKAVCYDILEEIERLDVAVKDFLLYARTPEPNLLPVGINAIIEKVLGEMLQLTVKNNVRIDFEQLEEGHDTVLADPDQIEKVLYNIAAYQVRQMTAGGTLAITCEQRRDEREIMVCLSDTGAGIAAEKLPFVFKPFFSTRQLGGGLKLAISKNVVEKHKGRTEVKSVPGKGTTFTIFLPMAETAWNTQKS